MSVVHRHQHPIVHEVFRLSMVDSHLKELVMSDGAMLKTGDVMQLVQIHDRGVCDTDP